MRITAEPIAVPAATGADGVVRVGGTRVSLDILVNAFRAGQSPEEIADHYPVPDLADVYAALTLEDYDEFRGSAFAIATQSGCRSA